MSPVSRRRQTKRPPQRWEGTRLLPLGNAATEPADIPGACDLLISHLDGTLAQRGITPARYIALLIGLCALVGGLAERIGSGPSTPAAYRAFLEEIKAEAIRTAEAEQELPP